MPFWSRKQRPTEIHHEPRVDFLGEQDGGPERELKAALTDEFVASASVELAYLARVSYGDPNAYEVALCLHAPEDPVLVERIGRVFAAQFGRAQHLDIMFLTSLDEARLLQVCAPFYRRNAA